ncbi:FAD-dependent oxidoreductase [Saccharopolyspora pogona]|uniref:FAD-dependent oxidoreductase n=1 Tax=Saccharopolyspora pogona TaxID=333966 RepID=UPI001CC25255
MLETTVRGGSIGDAEHLSARYALRHFASYPAHEKENRLFVLNGMQALTTGMAARLAPGTIELSTQVTKVTSDATAGVYAVSATGPAGPVEYHARQVLLAVPATLVDSRRAQPWSTICSGPSVPYTSPVTGPRLSPGLTARSVRPSGSPTQYSPMQAWP